MNAASTDSESNCFYTKDGKIFIGKFQLRNGAKRVGPAIEFTGYVQMLVLEDGKHILQYITETPKTDLISRIKEAFPFVPKVQLTDDQINRLKKFYVSEMYPGFTESEEFDSNADWLVGNKFLRKEDVNDRLKIRATNIAMHKVLRLPIPDGIFPKRNNRQDEKEDSNDNSE